MAKVVYLTYDGLLDPLGQSQVLPYLRGLARRGHEISIISFEKRYRMRSTLELDTLRETLAACGIDWVPITYHKRFSALATGWDNSVALVRAWRLAKRSDMIHLRSYALGPAVFVLNKALRRPFLFDMRGLWVQERIDGHIWPESSWLVRAAGSVELWLLQHSAVVISLTQASIKTIGALGNVSPGKVRVIPTCVDLDRFTPEEAKHSKSQVEFCYHGSLGTWYDTDRLASCVEMIRSMGHSFVAAVNDIESPEAARLVEAGAQVVSLPFAEVPALLRSKDVSVFFIEPSDSKIASMPTKLGEALASGLPILTGPGVGDVDALLADWGVGIVLDSDKESALQDALEEVIALAQDPTTATRCREVADSVFSLERGIIEYDAIYRELSLGKS